MTVEKPIRILQGKAFWRNYRRFDLRLQSCGSELVICTVDQFPDFQREIDIIGDAVDFEDVVSQRNAHVLSAFAFENQRWRISRYREPAM